MKHIFLFLLLAVTASPAISQKNDPIVSFDGIGQLKLGMGKAELEKLLQVKFVLKHIHVDGIYVETVQAKYLGKDVELYLMRSEEKVAIWEKVSLTHPIFKTADGMGMETDQSTIINKYKDQLLIIHPEYSAEGNPTNRTTIILANIDSYRDAIIFTMANKKVVAISVGPTPQFRHRE